MLAWVWPAPIISKGASLAMPRSRKAFHPRALTETLLRAIVGFREDLLGGLHGDALGDAELVAGELPLTRAVPWPIGLA